MKHTLIAVDVAKNVFQVAVSDRPGSIREHHRLSRAKFLPFFAERRPATVVLEACGSSHHWARQLLELGHAVTLLPPHKTRPYVTRNKTDRADAKGLLEAYRNQDIRPVPIKSIEQQGLTALHRLRSAWMADRTARINTIRGILRELGLFIPVGSSNLVPRLWECLEDGENTIPDFLRPALAEAGREIRALEQRVREIERELRRIAGRSPLVRRLMTIPGVGLLSATALVAFIGDVRRFPDGRHFASYLGLTPKEHSSGLVRRLGRITKRGDTYIRMLLIHGARAALLGAKRVEHTDRLRSWVLELEQRVGHNRAAVALANKLARIIWAVWSRDTDFQPQPQAA